MSELPELAIYSGAVCHHRRAPHTYRFRQPLLMLWAHSEQAEKTLRQRLGWIGALGIVNWRRQDYLPANTPLADTAYQRLRESQNESQGDESPAGAVYVLAQPRQFGFSYNPAAFYFLCDKHGKITHLLIEVHNTPWNERFCYSCPVNGDNGGVATMQKRHRVSPFNPPQMTYEWKFCHPSDRFFIRMRCRHKGQLHFEATLLLRRQAFSRRRLLAAAARLPLSAAYGKAAIYWRALRLWLKKTPLHHEQFGGR